MILISKSGFPCGGIVIFMQFRTSIIMHITAKSNSAHLKVFLKKIGTLVIITFYHAKSPDRRECQKAADLI